MQLTKREFTKGLILATGFASLYPAKGISADISATEARAIAKEAYIYGFPMVDSYRIQYAYFVNTKDPEYKGPGTSWSTSHVSIRRPTRRCRLRTPIRRIQCSAWISEPNRWC